MSDKSESSKLDQGKSPEQCCGERATRMAVAGALQQPDRIPIVLSPGMLPAEIDGIPRHELYEDVDKQALALEHFLARYQPDGYLTLWEGSGPSAILGEVMSKYPGRGLGPNDSFQFHEGEYMKQEDYDAFLADPADWSVRTYLPRTYTALEGLSMLPHLAKASYGHYSMGDFLLSLAQPQVVSALAALTKAAEMHAAWFGKAMGHMQRLASLGYPPEPWGACGLLEAPFDYMSDTLRAMRGIFLDIRRCPDKLLAAEEKVSAFQIEGAIARHKATGLDSVFIPLHRGSDGFMSLPVFERFYWPQLKSMMVQLVEAGITPFVFYEGCWNERLEYLAELPKGKTVGWFQQSDIFKVKKVIGKTMCIYGGMPVSMLLNSDPSEVREYTHKVCQEVGKGGGFIMSNDIGEMEGANPDLVDVWVEATKEFGKY